MCQSVVFISAMVEQPVSAQIRAVANSGKYKYKNIFFQGYTIRFEEECKWNHIFLIKYELVMNF